MIYHTKYKKQMLTNEKEIGIYCMWGIFKGTCCFPHFPPFFCSFSSMRSSNSVFFHFGVGEGEKLKKNSNKHLIFCGATNKMKLFFTMFQHMSLNLLLLLEMQKNSWSAQPEGPPEAIFKFYFLRSKSGFIFIVMNVFL